MASRSAILAIRIIADAAGAQKGLRATASATQRFEAGFAKASKASAAGLAVLTAAAWDAAGSASRLAESSNAVGKVFGDAAGTIDKFGTTAAKSVGLSQAAFNELATSTGSLLTNFGYSAQDAADQTIVLAQRAADMASVFNTDVDTALAAVNAGLRGETEPLRAFGVNVSDAALKAKALELGLYSGKGALDANAKAQAAVALTMEQTAKVAGDFADTSDGMANRQRILSASFEDTKAKLGTALLPVIEKAIGILQSLADWVAQNTRTVQIFIGTVAALAAAIVTARAILVTYRTTIMIVRTAMLVWRTAALMLNMALIANPVGIIIAAIVALIAVIVVAYKKSDTFRNIVDSIGRVVKGAFVAAMNAGRVAVDKIAGAFRAAWDWVQRLIAKVQSLIDKVKGIGGGILDAILPGRSLLALPGPAPDVAGLARTGPAPRAATSVGGSPTIIVNALDPYTAAREVKRAIEGYDTAQGRAPWTPLATAW